MMNIILKIVVTLASPVFFFYYVVGMSKNHDELLEEARNDRNDWR